jgi:hypothetical protein
VWVLRAANPQLEKSVEECRMKLMRIEIGISIRRPIFTSRWKSMAESRQPSRNAHCNELFSSWIAIG